MPLPAALAARLKQRGILSVQQEIKPPPATAVKTPVDEEVEEVFAEDYDEPAKEGDDELPETAADTLRIEEPEDDDKQYVREVPACPNRWNSFHECSDYCEEHWGMKEWSPSQDMIRKRDRMLGKYSLPPEWEEVADPETDRYYYWNTVTDQVSWLSPIHPKAVVTISVEKFQAVLRDEGQDRVESESEDSEEEDMDVSDSDSSSSSSSDEDEFDRRHEKGRLARERGGGGRDTGGRQRGRREVDPMDPSSYSDVPRGGWSSGLERGAEAKTGVDSTASGPLFQQRPYPSPGAVLRANKAAGKPS